MPTKGRAAELDRKLAVRRRVDLMAVPQTFSGQKLWAIKDPVTLRYFHLRDEEYWVLDQLDGSASLASIQARFEEHFAPRRITLAHLQSFLGLLHEEGLILADAPGQAAELLKRARTNRRQKLISTISNVLAIRFRGIDPQRFLDWGVNRLRWLISRWSFAACLALVLAAATLIATRYDAMHARLPEMEFFLTPSTVVWLSVALALVKVLHELGHGLTCRYFGAECHEMGLMFLVFTPCLYCNISDAWMIPNKWRRAAIGAAGVCVELVLAALCTLLWWFSEPGLLNSLCLNIVLVSSAGTLLFNANPLMRYDGYYILADLVEVPNLAQQAAEVVRNAVGEWALGIPSQSESAWSRGKRLFLGIYGVSSTVYRFVILFGILWYLHGVLKPYHLEILVILLAAMVAAGLVGPPLWRFARFVQQASWSGQMNKQRAYLSGLSVAAVIAVVLFVPFPHRIAAPVVLEAENARHVYVPVAGTMEKAVETGATVGAGAPLAVLTNLDLELEIAKLRGQRDEQKLHLENLKNRQARDDQAAAQIPTAVESLADLEDRLQRRMEDEKRLVVTAPVAGTVLPARARERAYAAGELESWTGLPLDAVNRGCFFDTGTYLCQIGDPGRLEASLHIDQGDVAFIRPGQHVQIQLDQLPGQALSGTVREVAEIDLKVTPPELLKEGMIATRQDESGVSRPVGAYYQARISLDTIDHPLLIGQAGRAKVHADPQSLARRLARVLNRTFRFEL